MTSSTIPAPKIAPPCPPWCAQHDNNGTHLSTKHVWDALNWSSDFPRLEIRYYRGDDDTPFVQYVQYPDNVGMTVLDVGLAEIDPGFSLKRDDHGNPMLTGYYLTAAGARSLALFLLNLAEQIDPHHINGEPIELRPQCGNERRP